MYRNMAADDAKGGGWGGEEKVISFRFRGAILSIRPNPTLHAEGQSGGSGSEKEITDGKRKTRLKPARLVFKRSPDREGKIDGEKTIRGAGRNSSKKKGQQGKK